MQSNDHPFLILGVLNLTPDSFSDGGRYVDLERAVDHAVQMREEGADLIDLGAESTRPGAQNVAANVEWARLDPVLNALAKCGITQLSIDTYKPEVMLRAAKSGISFINCVDGIPDRSTLFQLAEFSDLRFCAMHCTGGIRNAHRVDLQKTEVKPVLSNFFVDAHQTLKDCGFDDQRIWLDPGFGFGKTDAALIELLRCLPAWAQQHQLLVGVSRKSWIGRMLGIQDPQHRDEPSKILELALALSGVKAIRTHSVGALQRIRKMIAEGL